jgi:cytochrome bd-type quinol oxidase subunit 2
MSQKLKTIILSVMLLFTFSAPVLVTSAVYADVTQTDINGQLKCGSNLDVNGAVNTSTPKACTTTTGSGNDFNTILKKIINILSVLVGAIAVIMVILGGFRYVTSAGSEKGVESAKKTILYALIGLVIVALAQVIVHFVLNNIA